MLMVYVDAMGGKLRFTILMSWFLLVELCRVGATVWLSYWTGIVDNPGAQLLLCMHTVLVACAVACNFPSMCPYVYDVCICPCMHAICMCPCMYLVSLCPCMYAVCTCPRMYNFCICPCMYAVCRCSRMYAVCISRLCVYSCICVCIYAVCRLACLYAGPSLPMPSWGMLITHALYAVLCTPTLFKKDLSA